MNTHTNPRDHDEAQDILDALRKIQDSAELRAEAEASPEKTLNRLGLSGVARHAVAFGIAAFFVGARPAQIAWPMGFWL